MRLEPSRRFAVSLSLGMLLSLGAVLPTAAATVSTLTGETLTSTSGSGDACTSSPYTVSGTATGPYAGTFTEEGSYTTYPPPTFSATFTIHSGATTVTGSKTIGPVSAITCASGPPMESTMDTSSAPYTATIQTPTGNYRDQGVSQVHVHIAGPTATLTESFTSSLTQPELIVPTSRDQCKDGGWKNYPQFKNQGQCVSFVEHNS